LSISASEKSLLFCGGDDELACSVERDHRQDSDRGEAAVKKTLTAGKVGGWKKVVSVIFSPVSRNISFRKLSKEVFPLSFSLSYIA
jgi:hypothetical protein